MGHCSKNAGSLVAKENIFPILNINKVSVLEPHFYDCNHPPWVVLIGQWK